MNRLVLLCIILLILTINITGCDLSSPLSQAPSPVPKEQESIIIEPIEPPAEIVLGQEKSFNIRPPQTIDKNSAGLNMDIVDGPKVSCASSSVDRWTLICEGIQEGVDVVKIIVTAPDGTVIDGKRDVTILPPPPTDTPTPTPTEEPTDTPTPTEEPSPTASPPAAGDILPVADFNNCGSPNNLGGEIGTANPEGISIDEYIVEEGRGCIAKLGYEIKEWAGLYLKLEGLNASNYDTLTFDAKGEADPSTWPQSFKIELKRNNNSETSIVRHFEISDTWQKYGVSLSDFTGSLSGWDNLSELVFVFEKEHSGPKGILYLDDIALTSASISTDTPPPTPTNTSTLTPTETTVQVATPIGRCPFAEGPRRPPLESSTSDIGVEFEVPQHCDTGVETSMEIGGIFTSELTNQEIWILVYPTDSEYYPQTLNSCEQIPSEASGGLWRTWANFGGPPQQYDLVAVVTTLDGEASQEFKRWLAEGCATGNYPGYLRENLPNGLTEVGAITVSTKSPEESSVQPAAIASPASEPCDDDVSRYGFCSGAMGWVPQGNAPGVQAVNAVAQSLDQAQSGQASLKLSVDLIGGNHGSHSGGETFVDMFRNLPAGMTTFGPYDFNGVTITCWVYTPPGSAGDPGSPNGLQVFVKDASEDFRSEYGTWENITPEREGRWFPIALTVSPETPRDGYKDEGFDPTRIALLGVKIGAGGQSTDAVRYTGPIYVDACDW